ncbi:glycine--tRNA ligase, mitochondrial 1-like [Rhodamnia argentea]|uniref:Glycine--tRNA ligase, mitochondrial 1-like n=1 Tax=Rhodamnia argentea TaxID=178133 RepID=A0A8B8Q978_9MYRT|nr:glycine--tRNA ligase, mitochondrial 1-like [Rhodamnia argentea]
MDRADYSPRKVLAGDGDLTREAFRETLLKALLEGGWSCIPSQRYRRIHAIYDYGLLGYDIKENLLKLWDRHFALEDSMRAVPLPHANPGRRRGDNTVPMVNDEKTGTVYRADHLAQRFL